MWKGRDGQLKDPAALHRRIFGRSRPVTVEFLGVWVRLASDQESFLSSLHSLLDPIRAGLMLGQSSLGGVDLARKSRSEKVMDCKSDHALRTSTSSDTSPRSLDPVPGEHSVEQGGERGTRAGQRVLLMMAFP